MPDPHADSSDSPFRCTYVFPSGRRCRQVVAPTNANFCKTHAAKPASFPPEDPGLAEELIRSAGALDTPEDVKMFMAGVLRATADRRLPGKEATVLCYIAHTMLRCIREHAQHQKVQTETADAQAQADRFKNGPDKLTWNLPR